MKVSFYGRKFCCNMLHVANESQMCLSFQHCLLNKIEHDSFGENCAKNM